MAESRLETILIVHAKENRKKCSIECLRDKPGFNFRRFTPGAGGGLRLHPELPADLPANYVRLGLGGKILSTDDSEKGLLVLDGTWKRAITMEAHFSTVPIRSLPELKTAYPRVSKIHDDPGQGLATIEAIFAAYLLTGRDTAGLLDEYRWQESFLSANAEWIERVRLDGG